MPQRMQQVLEPLSQRQGLTLPDSQSRTTKQKTLPTSHTSRKPKFGDLYVIVGIALFIAMLGAVLVSDSSDNIQTDSQAAATDARILADELGISVDAVRQSVDFQNEFDSKLNDLYGSNTTEVSAVWVDPVPATSATVVFVGDVPPVAQETFAELDVELRPDGLISTKEHKLRADLLHAHLKRSGLDNFESGYRGQENAITIEIPQEQFDRPGEVDRLTRIALRTPLQSRSADGTTLTGRSAQLESADFTFSGREGPALTLTHTRGGARIDANGSAPCTTAFTVWSPYGDGVLSAGHCVGITRVFDHNAGSNYGVNRRAGHTGAAGDYALYTTGHIEPREFHADGNRLRSVTAVQPTWSMPGKPVCHYGRSSQVRTCNHTIDAIGRSVTAQGTSIGNQARVSNPVSIVGDSGGGWSYSTTAHGITTGHSGSWDYFTPAAIAASNMGATVKTS